MIEFLQNLVQEVGEITISVLELIGILIIVYGIIITLIRLFKTGFNLTDHTTKILLGESLALSLQVKLGAEIIKTVVVRDLNELLILGVIVILRIVLTYVIHWEVEKSNFDSLSDVK